MLGANLISKCVFCWGRIHVSESVGYLSAHCCGPPSTSGQTIYAALMWFRNLYIGFHDCIIDYYRISFFFIIYFVFFYVALLESFIRASIKSKDFFNLYWRGILSVSVLCFLYLSFILDCQVNQGHWKNVFDFRLFYIWVNLSYIYIYILLIFKFVNLSLDAIITSILLVI